MASSGEPAIHWLNTSRQSDFEILSHVDETFGMSQN